MSVRASCSRAAADAAEVIRAYANDAGVAAQLVTVIQAGATAATQATPTAKEGRGRTELEAQFVTVSDAVERLRRAPLSAGVRDPLLAALNSLMGRLGSRCPPAL